MRYSIIYLLLFVSFPLFALPLPENLRFRHFMQDSDITVGEVLAFEQDKYGFIWIGGKLGLARYDGKEFKIFRHDKDDPKSLPSNTINDIVADERGRLWIATIKGIARFDFASETFHPYRHDHKNASSLSADITYKIRFDRHGKMWITTRDGLDLYNPHADNFTRYPRSEDDPLLYTAYTMDITQDEQGIYYIGTGYGLKIWDPALNKVVYHKSQNNNPRALQVGLIRVTLVDSKNRVWLGTEKGLMRYRRKTQDFDFYPTNLDPENTLDSAAIWDLIEDSVGNLWVATDGQGVGYVDEEKQKIITSRNQVEFSDSLSNDIIRRVFEDRTTDIWVGTHGGTVDVFERYSSAFRLIRKSSENGLSVSNVRSFFELDDGTLWIGTDGGGINYFDPDKNQYRVIEHQPGNLNSLKSNDIIDIEQDSKGHIWVAKWKSALSVLEPETGNYRHYDNIPGDPTSISNTHTWKVLSTSDGNLWVATIGSGINRYNPESDNFTNYIHDRNNPSSLPDDLVWDLAEDHDGTLWIATENGLGRYNAATDDFTVFRHKENESTSLSSNRVLALIVSDSNQLWIGTHGGGLNLFDRVSFSAITNKDGLISDVVNSIVEDQQGVLWIGSNKGISSYDPVTREIKTYDKHDGLQAGGFNIGAAFRAQNGDILMGGVNGVTRFNPETISANNFIPPVHITKLAIQHREQTIRTEDSVLEKAAHMTKEIALKHSQNMFTLSFAALNFRNPNKNQYAYKLEGFDDVWHNTGNEAKATYTNLDPGRYLFRVKASNNDGLWNELGTSLTIRVIPPIWQTTWAYALYVILFASLIAGYFWSLKHTNHKLELEVQSRTKALIDANKKLEELVVKDLQTGLGNHRLLEHILNSDTAASIRKYDTWLTYGKQQLPRDADIVFYVIEIDQLAAISKKINQDQLNQLLMEFANELKKSARDSDFVIRWKESQFLIISRNLSRYKANILAERIKSNIAGAQIDIFGETQDIRCSIGYSCFPFNPKEPNQYNWETNLVFADYALQIAKNSGQENWLGLLATIEKAYSTHDLKYLALDHKITLETSLNGLSAINWST